MDKKQILKTRKLSIGVKVLLIVCGLIASIIIFLYAWQLYKDANPQSYITFKQFTPTKIIDNLHIQNKEIDVWAPSTFLWFAPNNFIVNLTLNRIDSYINEAKNKNTPFKSKCDAINEKCISRTSPQGQQYQIIYTYATSDLTDASKVVYDNLQSEQTLLVKDGTNISIVIKSNNTPIAEQDWDIMIDSFTPTTFTDLKVKHMYPGP